MWAPANADYEAAFGLALCTAQERRPGLRHIAFGDLFLTDVHVSRGAAGLPGLDRGLSAVG
jgi:hypothetical protein